MTTRIDRRNAIGILATAMIAPWIAGCHRPQVAGDLRTVSIGADTFRLRGRFATAVYAVGEAHATLCLSEIPLESFAAHDSVVGQVVAIDLLWKPIAGRTPLDEQATNASVRQVIFSEGRVGVYGGAGMAYPGKIGKKSLKVAMKGVSMTLMESTAGFNDLLSPAEMSGNFNCRLDPQATERLRFAVSQAVTDALGRTYRV